MLLPQEVIRKKRDGKELETKEIERFIEGIADWSISDGQIAALAMAIVIQGMNKAETVAMIKAIVDTGMVLDWTTTDLNGPIIDGHTTGGVGDKTDILFAPIIAACGGYVPMISGRGLHHTGGTIDKLEAIPNYNTSPENPQLRETIKNVGCAIIGATSKLISVDRRIYPIRDVTATVNSVPLTTASIVSKKLAAGIKDALIIDAKLGNGTFTVDIEETRRLARALVSTACEAGLPTSAIISDMNQVMGYNAGNALEIKECIDFLNGKKRNPRIFEIILAACSEALILGKIVNTKEEAETKIKSVLDSGHASEKFGKMIASLGGPTDIMEKPDVHMPEAKFVRPIYPEQAGIITDMNTRWIGLSVIHVGGGRLYLSQKLEYAVGFSDVADIGETVDNNRPIAVVHAETEDAANAAIAHIRNAITIGDKKPNLKPTIYEKITIADIN